MRSSLTLLALAASAFAAPQAAVTEAIKPEGSAPEGCETSYDGKFEVSIFRLSGSDKRDLHERRECNGDGVLVMTLEDGVLTDNQGRTGYIASNYQLQFDSPPQAGAKFTSGFSACSNQSLALGSSTVFYQCQSGDFFNLYDRSWAEQCEPIEIAMMPCGGGSGNGNPKRKVVGSSIVATTVVTVVSDGESYLQTTAIAVPMCQIGDGQVQVRTTPCDNMDIPIITAPPVSQVSDGKLQVPSTAPPAPASVPASNEDVPAPQGTSAGETPETPAAIEPQGTPAPGTAAPGTAAPGTPATEPQGTAADGKTKAEQPAGTTVAPTASDTGISVMKFDTSLPTMTEGDETPQSTDSSEESPKNAAPAATSAPSSSSTKIIPASISLLIGTIGYLIFL
ncbi:Fc.00g114960.m01.CDS01 [Cosmosporella sp. VM-42]